MEPVDPDLRAARLDAQGLRTRELPDPAAVCERLLAVQGQDPRGFRLAVRARSAASASADVDAGLNSGALLVDTLCRCTLHLVRREDHAWLHPLLAPRWIALSDRRLGEVGVTADQAERGRAVLRDAVAADGPLLRAELRARLEAADVPTAGQAVAHIVGSATLRRQIVRGPMPGPKREQAFALAADWLGPPPDFDRDAALAELGRRHLVGHRGSTPQDLARWTGLGVRDCRRAFEGAVAAGARERPDGRWEASSASDVDADDLPPPRLLGPFDPTLHGWTDREWIVGGHRGLITINGIFKAFALVDGRAVATWREPGGKVELDPLGRLPRGARAALEADAEDVAAYWSRSPSSTGYSRR